jgi:hypothetical protein
MKSVLFGAEIDAKGHLEKQTVLIRPRCDSASIISNSSFESKKQNLRKAPTEQML